MTSAPVVPGGDDLPERLQSALDGFVGHLRDERGCSAHTVRAYRGDVLDLLEYCSMKGVTEPAGITLAQLRGWLAPAERPWPCTGDDRPARGLRPCLHRLVRAPRPGHRGSGGPAHESPGGTNAADGARRGGRRRADGPCGRRGRRRLADRHAGSSHAGTALRHRHPGGGAVRRWTSTTSTGPAARCGCGARATRSGRCRSAFRRSARSTTGCTRGSRSLDDR